GERVSMHGVAAPRCGPFASTSATDMRVLTLAGGTGAAKLIRGLATCMPQRDLTVIGNTGDDTEVWGLRVSPDLDTVMYALAGMLDVERGWGLAGETFNCLAAMATHGADTWFNLGDRDLATHLTRTRALDDGQSLATVTARLAGNLGVRSEEHTSELQSRFDLVCRLLLEKKKTNYKTTLIVSTPMTTTYSKHSRSLS